MKNLRNRNVEYIEIDFKNKEDNVAINDKSSKK